MAISINWGALNGGWGLIKGRLRADPHKKCMAVSKKLSVLFCGCPCN